ncbi:MAG: IS30 family transposase [Lachnospiraceae bacterium]|nr:IS30 family transposase [Lachnospiraceae bacterium]
MKNPKKQKPDLTRKHLTYKERCEIEALLKEGYSQREIANRLNRNPSTISREIQNHAITKKSRANDCLLKRDCKKLQVCDSRTCKKNCRTCPICKKYCPDYIQMVCEDRDKSGLCNSCRKSHYCNLEKRFYKADTSENEYREVLVGRRNGFDLTYEQIEEINNLVSPLIKKGQSPYHIKQALGDKLCISEATLRRMIAKSELDVRLIDLKEAVKRKSRKRRRKLHHELPSVSKVGRMYEDYLDYIKENELSIVEMDCVEGKQEDKCAILTLHFVQFHMQLYYIMPEHTCESVVATLDMIEEALGYELFSSIFEVILTDNGHEFWDYDGMEHSCISGGSRTKVFFCDPNRSDQKGSCENNHKLLRCVIPKGTSIDAYSMSDMVKVTNHVNSYCRKSLYGRSPFDVGMAVLPEDFFILLGLERIPAENVVLTPALLR